MSVGIGGNLRTGGRHPFFVIRNGSNALNPDIAESDSATPVFSGATGGWVCNVNNSANPRGLFNVGTPDVEIRVNCKRSDGAAIYFRRESPTKMWRISFGDFVSSTTTYPGFHSPGTASSCTLSGTVTHTTQNFCECSNIYTGHTIYSGSDPSYDYLNFWGGRFNSACGSACPASTSGCTHECLLETRRSFYFCTGGTAASHSPGETVTNYGERWNLEYRNGSTSWVSVAQVNASVGDMRILARGTSIQLFFGSVSTNVWNLYSTYTDNFTNVTGVNHGVGSGNTSVRYSSLNGGLNSLWIESL
jgi:hypothetical protein